VADSDRFLQFLKKQEPSQRLSKVPPCIQTNGNPIGRFMYTQFVCAFSESSLSSFSEGRCRSYAVRPS
jgi:hypothetical protein